MPLQSGANFAPSPQSTSIEQQDEKQARRGFTPEVNRFTGNLIFFLTM
jgi:hypothetical protein